jgi:GAF domain-containing protein
MPDPSHDEQLAGELRRLLAAIEAGSHALLPSSNLELLQSIVDTAARLFGAAAASISLVTDEQDALVFEVATGAGRDDVVGRRIPVDHGLAGYVAMTGQPIAVSNVQQDPRFKQDFAESTGYVPRSILATPLVVDGQVIGVMEVLDKISAPTFGLQDMELVGVFAYQAALAIRQSQRYEQMAGRPAALRQALAGAEGDTVAGAADLGDLAALFYAIGGRGPAERKACLQILAAFGEYASAQPRFD